jgi:hypothetical protein
VKIKNIFLASSFELKTERDQFALFIREKNDAWVEQGVYLKLVMWEDFLDLMSKTRLQDEYNKAISVCDIFVMLYWTKVGTYTAEEFETAFKHFQATSKPFVYTYFKVAAAAGKAKPEDIQSLAAFQKKLADLGHFRTVFANVDALKFHFNRQLDKLAENGFAEFNRDDDAMTAPSPATEQGTLTGSGAISQGCGTAVGAGGVFVGGNNSGSVNTGTQTIASDGGAFVTGSVQVGGDFIGRDMTQQRRRDGGSTR